MNEPKIGEFEKFIDLLMDAETAPEGYSPWLIPCKPEGKAPDTTISWKAPQSRLTPAEAKKRLKNQWGNVGIAGKPDDRLILLDIDDPSIEDELKPTLKIRSRSRSGTHAIYWADPEDEALPANIPTEKGELRSSDQYVVAPGSYVPCTEEELEEKVEEGEITEEQKEEILEDPDRGYYTIDKPRKIAPVTLEELPDIFEKQYRKSQDTKENDREDYTPEQISSGGDHSALYDLEITDLTSRGLTDRDPHPIHNSTTGANWSISQGVGHCWRHTVSLNALQFLCVEAGLFTCLEAGTPHTGSSAGPSEVKGNDEAIWVAWKHAKENGYIPEDDPVPVRAMWHIARKHEIGDPENHPPEGESKKLPLKTYKEVLELIEEKY
ncbi:putative DNA primase/helicase [Haloarcula vallismortis]|uniref:Ig-like domain-containing protein n=2 Tax=Haloarcula vallismortis TaxID=28442 RepID=M0JUG1_HALVA|nr:bifunctional DNA primase/polymerase [Haloarcula vallismortis]EMA11599.1 hypothetical protein C437_01765 [Haloarcula vallismortis ATCC 29715]SDW45918.1 putative DNA primase/helicase [Haloarcula vallismortis]